MAREKNNEVCDCDQYYFRGDSKHLTFLQKMAQFKYGATITIV